MTTSTLSKDEALSFAKEWVQERTEKPKYSSTLSSQKNWLMGQLAARCVAEALRQGDTQWDLEDRLQHAWDLLNTIQVNARHQALRDLIWKKSERDMTDEEKKKVDAAEHRIWKRHDPQRAYFEGESSEHTPGLQKGDLLADCADYLERPWLRHPVVDWMLLDMLITRELVAFGEHIKENMLPGPRGILGVNERYIDANGNLAEMQKIRWGELGDRLWVKGFWTIIVPVGAIILSFMFGAEGAGSSLLSIWGGLWAAFLGLKVLRGAARLAGLGRFVDPTVKAKKLWEEMYRVWKLLEGPVVNPMVFKESLMKSKEAGAVWDMPAYSIIDKIIADDPAVWVVDPSRR
jgi:hypothetical protein